MVVLFPENEIEVICTCIALSLGYYSLREHQKDIVTNVVTGNAIYTSIWLRQESVLYLSTWHI